MDNELRNALLVRMDFLYDVADRVNAQPWGYVPTEEEKRLEAELTLLSNAIVSKDDKEIEELARKFGIGQTPPKGI